ncbi:MAG: hypothetical protein AW08_00157 [Candidatus Accumulibacter adjunctus]|uniref:PIN domain-containing protein n=1 Tax=Candidatus Accumulibacter adjunctus TaxID=1454001 RepID=A0A011PTH0_9PROT|nr:MAG: hypothetical protein AW08_00157 [Candidatus Accumulibacter adjunctus]
MLEKSPPPAAGRRFPDGAARALVRLLVERGHECWADPCVLVKDPESLRVLDALLPYLGLAAAVPLITVPAHDVAWLSEKDRPVLEAAIRLRCDALVTGDRTHFGAGYGRAFGDVLAHSLFLTATRAQPACWRRFSSRPFATLQRVSVTNIKPTTIAMPPRPARVVAANQRSATRSTTASSGRIGSCRTSTRVPIASGRT